MEEIGN